MDDGLVVFLRARLDERAARAKAAAVEAGEAEWEYDPSGHLRTARDQGGAVVHGPQDFLGPQVGEFLADNDPARVLREVEAKRRVVDRYAWLREHGDTGDMAWVLPLLAAVYADHPDYRPEWAPTT